MVTWRQARPGATKADIELLRDPLESSERLPNCERSVLPKLREDHLSGQDSGEPRRPDTLTPRGARSEFDALHEGLIGGSAIAREQLARLLLVSVSPIIRRRFRWLDREVVNDAVEDSIMDYLGEPLRFDRRVASLVTFVSVGATRNVLEVLRRMERRQRIERAGKLRQFLDQEGTIDSRVDQGLLMASIRNIARTSMERKFLVARLGGENRPEALAKILEIQHLAPHEQQREVKRVTERLRIRGRRLAK